MGEFGEVVRELSAEGGESERGPAKAATPDLADLAQLAIIPISLPCVFNRGLQSVRQMGSASGKSQHVSES